MCFDYDALPPAPAGVGPLAGGRQVILTAGDGTRLLAWHAPAAAPSGAAVVILPDVRGLFAFYQRLAETFAAIGVDAVAVDYFGRTAGTGPRGADFDFMAHVAQTTPDGVAADAAAGIEYLRSVGEPRAIFTVGFCFGGTNSFLLGTRGGLGLAGVVGFYGAMKPRTEGGPTPITEAPRTQVPVLGLFGGADPAIPPDKIAEYEAGLAEAGVEYAIHAYPGAPHSFFDRGYADYAAECADAWQRMREFITAHTP